MTPHSSVIGPQHFETTCSYIFRDQNVKLPNDAAPYPRKTDVSSTPLKKRRKGRKKLNKLFFAEHVFVVELPSVAAASVNMLMDRMDRTLNLSC